MTVVQAPSHWQRVDFISDVHLDANESQTFEAWQRFMANTPADALFIWVTCLKCGWVMTPPTRLHSPAPMF